ncbi:MAG: hemolysin family protein [Actinomycetota bacterium]
MNDVTALFVAVLLLGGNAFFVGAEFALISARRTQIEPRAASGSKTAKITLRAMENVSLMMAGAQLGITMCSLGLGAVGEPAVAHLIEGPFTALGMPEAFLHPTAFAIALSIVILLHMVLGEMVPKNLALAAPTRSALLLGPPIYAIVFVLKPLILALNTFSNGVVRLLRTEPRAEVASVFTHEEVAALIAESRREGLLGAREHQLLKGALSLPELTVRSVLIPMDKLVTVEHGASFADVEARSLETGFSRFPVTGSGGELLGYLHVKDVLEIQQTKRLQPVPEDRIRLMPTLLADDLLDAALKQMQERGTQMAQVHDDTGTPLGAVAMEDVLAELVGSIRDAMQHTGN